MTPLFSELIALSSAQAATVGLDTGDVAQSPAAPLYAAPTEKDTARNKADVISR